MARWIYNRPLDRCDATELKVAKQLAKLSDEWVIRWGFFYDGDREGDFLVCGPDGGVLVLEVKGGQLRKLSSTGRWDGPEQDHPINQLMAEWKAVLSELEKTARGRKYPFVAKAICLPDIFIPPNTSVFKDISREMLIDQNDLATFVAAWKRLFAGKANRSCRAVFMDAFAGDIEARAIQHFISETDRILLRHALQEFEILDMLRENCQLLVQGGPGTGKTWLAFEQAYRWAESGSGKKVLLLSYNLALARLLGEMAEKRRPKRGKITVKSWESLARQLYKSAGLDWEPPGIFDPRRRHFFEVEVPAMLQEIVSDEKHQPLYDALVVDEAQDHDTAFAGSSRGDEAHSAEKNQSLLTSSPTEAGWWDFYFKLLHGGNTAPIAAFFDPAQRPLFRERGDFDEARLRKSLSQSAYVKLPYALRYSRPVFTFLKTLRSETTEKIVQDLHCRATLPEGPNVEIYETAPSQTGEKIREIVRRWVRQGLCKPEEILILSPHSHKNKTSLADWSTIGDWPLAEYERRQPNELALLSINKAKGLDSLGVILIDLAPFEKLAEGQDKMNYFMGASRARQLLAGVHISD